MESMEEKVLLEMAELRRFIGDHFEKQHALMMNIALRRGPRSWPSAERITGSAGPAGPAVATSPSPFDNSQEEIPIEAYHEVCPGPSKDFNTEVPMEGVLVKSPQMQSVLQLGTADTVNTFTSGPLASSLTIESSQSLRSSDTFVHDFVKRFEKKASVAAETLKQKRRTSMVTQVERDSSFRAMAKRLVKSPFFAYVVTTIITFNLVILGIEVDVSTSLGTSDIPSWFGLCNAIVVVLFCIEMAISLFAQGCNTFFCGRERWWNLFDLVIILVSLLETILDFWASSTTSNSVNASQLRMVRTVRLARALRGIRVMRLLRYVSALRTLVLSIMSSMASLLWTLVLLMLLFYSFGVLFTQLVSDECRFQAILRTENPNAVPLCEADFADGFTLFWSSIPESMLTLFLSITGGLDWEIALKPLRQISILAVACLVMYITITFFAIVNVITGVFVTTAMETTSADKDLVVMKQLQKRNMQVEDLKQLFADISGGEERKEVGIDEFKQAMSTPKLSGFLQSMGISTEDVGVLFKLLDADASGLVELEEFVSGCLSLHGAARSSQLARMSYENKLTRREIKLMQKSLADLNLVLRMMLENWSV